MARPRPALLQRRLFLKMRGGRKKPRSSCFHPRGLLDGTPDSLVSAATADVALHRRVDLGVARLGPGLQQRGSLHHLAGLAITTLRHITGLPRALDGMIPV